VDLQLEPDQLELQRVARDLLDRHSPLSLSRASAEGSPAAWADLWDRIAELGWMGLGSGEDDGFGFVGACVVAREIGTHVAPVPFIDHLTVSRILASGGEDAALAKWGERLAAGDPIVSLAAIEDRVDWGIEDLGASAHRDGDGWRLVGAKRDAAYAGTAGGIAVIARTDDGLGLFLVDGRTDGVEVTPLHGFDHSRALSRVVVDVRIDAADAVVGPGADEAIKNAFLAAALASAAEGIGAAGGALDMAIEYAKERQQFRTPIGAFQALAHIIADLHVLRETAWSSVLYAAATIDDGLEEWAEAVAIAKAHSARAAREIGEGALQIFGGIAFSQEHDAHLLHGRALDCEQRFGDSRQHEAALTRVLRSRAGQKVA
jgi:alkylation response protein AidB-like acyl-CoA dehydrogenase